MFQLIDNVKCHRESTPNILTSNICQYENMSLKYIQLGTGQFISQLYIYPMPFNSYKLKNINSKQDKIFLTGKISAIFLNKILDQSNLPLYIFKWGQNVDERVQTKFLRILFTRYFQIQPSIRVCAHFTQDIILLGSLLYA